MHKPRTPAHPPIIAGTNSQYWQSKDGSAPRTLCFQRFEDGGKTLVGRYKQQLYLVATDDYEPLSNKGYEK